MLPVASFAEGEANGETPVNVTEPVENKTPEDSGDSAAPAIPPETVEQSAQNNEQGGTTTEEPQGTPSEEPQETPTEASDETSYVAMIGEIGYATLAEAAKAAEEAETEVLIVLVADSDENFTLPVGVSFYIGSHITYTGEVSAPKGYEINQHDGYYTVVLAATADVAAKKVAALTMLASTPEGNVAKIGETGYATLSAAFDDAKKNSGSTIELLADTSARIPSAPAMQDVISTLSVI